MSLYSVVVPVYNSEHTLTELYTRLEKVFRETVQEPFELILVDDGSKDRSYQIMEELRQKDSRVNHPDGEKLRTASGSPVWIFPCGGRFHHHHG